MSLINRDFPSSFDDHFRHMDDVFRSMERAMLAPWGLGSRFPFGVGGHRSVSLDFHETKDGFELIADLPGLKQNDISVDVDTDSGVLTVSGERKEEVKHEREEEGDGDDGKTKKYHFVERSYGKMSRSIRLPEAADAANATADYTSGVLTITFPKRDAPPRNRLRIPVSGSTSSDNVKVAIEGGGKSK